MEYRTKSRRTNSVLPPYDSSRDDSPSLRMLSDSHMATSLNHLVMQQPHRIIYMPSSLNEVQDNLILTHPRE